MLKERLLTQGQKQESVKDFALGKGLLMAMLGGIMSGCMAMAFHEGGPIAAEALKAHSQEVFKNMPSWSRPGGRLHQQLRRHHDPDRQEQVLRRLLLRPGVLLLNYFLAAISGLMWYGQYFFYGTGATKMGKYDFAGWSIFMAAIIIFSNGWGLLLREWRLVDRRTRLCLWLGILILVASVMIIGIGHHLAGGA